jgi:single-strand DNA-binding protein
VASLNRIILVGRVTADAESRSTGQGMSMAKFRLAVNRPQGGADFIDVVVWDKLADAVRDFLKKGRLVLVEGRIQIRSFDDQSGQKRWVTEVIARAVNSFDPVPAQPKGNVEEVIEEDAELSSDLPF